MSSVTIASNCEQSTRDKELQHAVREEIQWDSRVDAGQAAIGVEVCEGIVTLTGRVSSCSQRSAAQHAAHRVAGVLDVVNEIHVRPPDDDLITDVEIAHGLREAYVRDSRLPHDHIHTTVSDGVVTLQGLVPHLSQHDDAEALARSQRGVREVRNFIHVEPAALPEATLKQAISRALIRHAAHMANHVQVVIERSSVTLSGEVSSTAERLAVVGAVRGMPGIADVKDRIRVR